CPDESFSLDVQQLGNATTVVWNLGSGLSNYKTNSYFDFSYVTLGNHPIQAKVIDECGNDSILYDTVKVVNRTHYSSNVYLSATDSLCIGQEGNFDAGDGFHFATWTFSDGQVTEDEKPYLSFSTAGQVTYNVKLTDFCGNDTTLFDTIQVGNGGNFNGGVDLYLTDSLCVSEKYEFEKGSYFKSVTWIFGNGDTVTTTKDYYEYAYMAAGKYQVTKIVTDHCGNQSIPKTDSISIGTSVSEGHFEKIESLPDSVCPGTVVYFFQHGDAVSGETMWNLGDGTVSNKTFISHKYTNSGWNYVTHTFGGRCGTKVVLTDSLYVGADVKGVKESEFFAEFNLEAIEEEVCMGDSASFLSLFIDNSIIHYGDGTQGSFTVDSISLFSDDVKIAVGLSNHMYASKGNYVAYAVHTDGCGMKDTAYSDVLQVKDNVVVNAELDLAVEEEDVPAVYCTNTDISMIVSGGSSYSFDYGDGTSKTISGGQAFFTSHQFTAIGTYRITVEVTNACGDSDTATVDVNVTTECAKTDTSGNGIQDISNATIAYYPNPTGDAVNIDLSDFGGSQVGISVSNVQGQLLLTKVTQETNTQLSLKEFGAGIYFVNFNSESGSKTITVIVN
ncbi:MAG: PKD repeat protein, partial [Saprospiraceae bacterium]